MQNQDYGVISIDEFLAMHADETIYEDDVYEISESLCAAAATMLTSKQGIIIDHVITSERIFNQLIKGFACCNIVRVYVSCPLDELRRRERQRENRCVGSAEASLNYLFPKEGYDVEVNTYTSTSQECALEIMELLKA